MPASMNFFFFFFSISVKLLLSGAAVFGGSFRGCGLGFIEPSRLFVCEEFFGLYLGQQIEAECVQLFQLVLFLFFF